MTPRVAAAAYDNGLRTLVALTPASSMHCMHVSGPIQDTYPE